MPASRNQSPACLELVPIRQRVVLLHLAQSLSVQEIALAMSIYPSSVERHINLLRLRFKVRSRQELMDKAKDMFSNEAAK